MPELIIVGLGLASIILVSCFLAWCIKDDPNTGETYLSPFDQDWNRN